MGSPPTHFNSNTLVGSVLSGGNVSFAVLGVGCKYQKEESQYGEEKRRSCDEIAAKFVLRRERN